MKLVYLLLGSAALLAACNQTPPATEQPTAPATTAPVPSATPAPDTAAAARPDSAAMAPAPAAAPAAVATGPQTLKVAFTFRPVADPDNPARPRTSAHLLLQGPTPQDIDLGKFAGKPDLVDAAKAKAANFPAGMLLGFRSYSAATGTSSDLAVLHEDARHLRIVQRRVEETAPEAGKFETSREIMLPANTTVVVAPVPKPARK